MFGFISVAVRFHQKCAGAGVLSAKLRTVLLTLYASSLLILTRSIYRVVEYFEAANISDGDPGAVLRSEWYFWVFEATLMLVNSVLLNVNHPGRFLPRSNKIYLARDGVTELEGPGWVDKRPFLATLLDPFDLVGLFKGRDKETAFWESAEARGCPTTQKSSVPGASVQAEAAVSNTAAV